MHFSLGLGLILVCETGGKTNKLLGTFSIFYFCSPLLVQMFAVVNALDI